MRILLAAIAVLATASTANADLILNISGVAGAGVTNFEFVTGVAGTTVGTNAVQTNAADTWSWGDTAQFGTGNGIADITIQDQIFVLTGSALLTVGTVTENITGIFLDDDGTGTGDDLGVRVANQINYGVGESVTWTGTGSINLDITAFEEGTFQMNYYYSSTTWGLDGNNTIVNIRQVAVPEPSSSIAVIGLAAVGLVVRRRRR